MNKKELIALYGNTVIGGTLISNVHSALVHHMDEGEEKLLCSLMSGEKIISYHYVKYDEYGRFRIGNMNMNLKNFLRVSTY